MKCPKCAGLLAREDIREQYGRFQGWRCIQCGFRLDELMARNRAAAPPASDEPTDAALARSIAQLRGAGRPKRSAGKA